MHIISLAFQILTLVGLWRPIAWTSSLKRIIYDSYSFTLIFSLYIFLCSLSIDMFTADNMDDFTESSHMLLTMVIGLCKGVNMATARGKIAKLLEIFTDEPCRPINPDELEIQEKCDKTIHSNTRNYAIMIETSVASSILNSLLTDLRMRRLPFKSWLPYDYSSSIIFYFTYTYQMVLMTACSLFHVAVDSLFCGFLLQICCQIDILECRLRRVNDYGLDDLRGCIKHHSEIYRIAEQVNSAFSMSVFIQFFISSLVLCVSLFHLLKNDLLSMEFLALMIYLSTLLVQIYIYCWYGNEVKLKSAHVAVAFAQSDWTSLDSNSKKMILVAIQRAANPFEFVSGYFVTVNLDTFVNLIKTSYSAYNVLQKPK